ncbi:MAG: trypsin-like serine protease [Elusimicrobiaceae bacterium]|nr:trypsin-like serine protease [Elusimicrobiaceae bacterium]
MKRMIVLLLCALSTVAMAKGPEGFFAEDFANQNVIFINDKLCQATRIAPNWYLTAAHCLVPLCDQSCRITFQMLTGELRVAAVVNHSRSDKHVFVHNNYQPNTDKAMRHDIALIHFTPSEKDWFRETASGEILNQKEFIEKLNLPDYQESLSKWQSLTNAHPKLLRVGNLESRRILQPVAVPDLRQGEGIYFKQSQPGDFYYSDQLRYFIGKNFGVDHGMSGSAVVIPGGDIIGVVSSNVKETGSLRTYNEEDESVGEIPFSTDFFVFTPINRKNADFIQKTIRSFHEHGNKVEIDKLKSSESEVVKDDVEYMLAVLSVNPEK